MLELNERTQIIFREMMSHPALFTHEAPKKIAILGDTDNHILQEVLKHPHIAEVCHQNLSHEVDIVINAEDSNIEALTKYYPFLKLNGILIQKSESPFDVNALQSLIENLKTIGFKEFQIMHFPQPSLPSGWGTAVMTMKHGVFKKVREKTIFNKSFKTHYYNFDIHQASLVLPEFMRETFFK
jgi:spermidine synthase